MSLTNLDLFFSWRNKNSPLLAQHLSDVHAEDWVLISTLPCCSSSQCVSFLSWRSRCKRVVFISTIPLIRIARDVFVCLFDPLVDQWISLNIRETENEIFEFPSFVVKLARERDGEWLQATKRDSIALIPSICLRILFVLTYLIPLATQFDPNVLDTIISFILYMKELQCREVKWGSHGWSMLGFKSG